MPPKKVASPDKKASQPVQAPKPLKIVSTRGLLYEPDPVTCVVVDHVIETILESAMDKIYYILLY